MPGLSNGQTAISCADDKVDSSAVRLSAPAEELSSRELPLFKRRLAYQEQVGRCYNSVQVQVLVAILITANFMTNIVEKELDPAGQEHAHVFKMVELGYNIAFTIEMLVNLYANWFWKFWSSKWNLFDVVVVTIGIINMMELPLPKAFSLLRMMRAFRVFRLFKRVKSLNKIIVAIVFAIPGVMNAFLILTIVMAIYAILAVEFFHDMAAGCQDSNYHKTGYLTNRKGCVGEEYFGTFSKSFYTFFQVLTGESWSEAVARPVIWYYEDPLRSLGCALFFVSFILVSTFVLTNVVVAVLLDKMVDPEVQSSQEDIADDVSSDSVGVSDTVKMIDDTVGMQGADLEISKRLNILTTQVSKLNGSGGEIGQCVAKVEDLKTELAAMKVLMQDMVKALHVPVKL